MGVQHATLHVECNDHRGILFGVDENKFLRKTVELGQIELSISFNVTVLRRSCCYYTGIILTRLNG